MYRILACVRDQHDYRLVLVAVAICALTVWTALYLYSNSLEGSRLKRLGWIFLTGVASGSGIWATHFIAMLAFKSGFPTVYDPALTLSSLVIAILVTGLGFAQASLGTEKWHPLAGGALIGIGIAAMHYTGMSAVNIPGRIHWHGGLVAASIVLGMLFAAAAMWSFHHTLSRWVGAALLTVAICSLHFTAMGAAAFEFDPTVVVNSAEIDNSMIALAIAGLTLLVVLSGLAAALINTHTARESDAEVRNLRQLAHQDWLTGLPNRAASMQTIDRAMDECGAAGCDFALLFVDLDRFKEINDSFGHAIGDLVLCEAAQRLRRIVPEHVFVARMGGDEFIIVQAASPQPQSAQALASLIVDQFEDGLKLADGDFADLRVSVGISVYPKDGGSMEHILRSADIALYQAKRDGGGRACFAYGELSVA